MSLGLKKEYLGFKILTMALSKNRDLILTTDPIAGEIEQINLLSVYEENTKKSFPVKNGGFIKQFIAGRKYIYTVEIDPNPGFFYNQVMIKDRDLFVRNDDEETGEENEIS